MADHGVLQAEGSLSETVDNLRASSDATTSGHKPPIPKSDIAASQTLQTSLHRTNAAAASTVDAVHVLQGSPSEALESRVRTLSDGYNALFNETPASSEKKDKSKAHDPKARRLHPSMNNFAPLFQDYVFLVSEYLHCPRYGAAAAHAHSFLAQIPNVLDPLHLHHHRHISR